MNKEQWLEAGEALAKARADETALVNSTIEQEQRKLDQQLSQDNERTRKYLSEIGSNILRNSPSLFVSFDAEMDGGSLLAYGAVTPWGESIKREVKPDTDFFVPSQREFCESHGLQRERLLEEGIPLDEAIYDLDMWVRQAAQEHDQDPVFMAFNVSEDWPLISNPMKHLGIKNPFGIAGYCLKSEALSLSMLTQPERNNPEKLINSWEGISRNAEKLDCDWKQTSKSKLPKWMVPDREFTHDPLEDAEYQLEIKYTLTGYIATVAVRNALGLEEEERIRNLPEPHDDGFFGE